MLFLCTVVCAVYSQELVHSEVMMGSLLPIKNLNVTQYHEFGAPSHIRSMGINHIVLAAESVFNIPAF